MNKRSWLLIILTWFLGNAGIYFISPALPALSAHFHCSPRVAQLTISLFLVGKAFSMLLWGGLADRLGRRRIFIFGIMLFTVSSVIAAVSVNIILLLTARVLQGIAVGATLLTGRVMVNDTQDEQQAIRQFGFLFSLAGALICFLPLLGSGINRQGGWVMAFWVMAAYGFFLLLLCRPLVETGKIGRDNLNMLASAGRVFANALYVRYLLISALMMAGESAFNTSSSFILMSNAHLGLTAYGGIKTAMAIAHVLGTLTCALLTRFLCSTRLVELGLYFFAAAAAGMCLSHELHLSIGPGFILPMMLYYFGTGFIVASATAAAVRPFPKHMAMALAVSLFCQFAVSALASFITSLLAIERAEHFMIIISIISAMAIVIWFRVRYEGLLLAE
ncbi:MFS transporter [Legionella sp. CNM-4043-24]|uniref:MFS transporter n=1 Tax=Legionella sp. CNM-4043-24 TaxID=3421646 RepID=UPI00403A971D